jgi:hypothetical protein
MIKKVSSHLINQVTLLGLGMSCLLIINNLQSTQLREITKSTYTKETYSKQQASEKLKLSLLKKMPALGFDNIVANLTMLKFIQYFGDSDARNQTGYSLSADYLEVITQNDPLFSDAYIIISPASSIFAGTPERTVAIMNQGLAKMSASTLDAYYIWLYKGVDEILFLGDLSAAKHSYQMSAEWANKAGNQKIAEAAEGTVKFLASNPDTKQAQIAVWLMVWINNKDERIRQVAQAKIESIGGKLKIYPDGRVEAIPPKIASLKLK